MPTGTLTGHALKIVALPFWDHTYVTSSDGHVWSCWGRSAGGVIICAGIGNTAKADCLAQPASQAAIVYGTTGVCHQSANRILFPAGQTVSRARGYRWSVLVWGEYGKDPVTNRRYSPSGFPWPELENCELNHHHP